MRYYIVINNKTEGPYSINELAEIGIHNKTLVWHEGLLDWAEAIQIKELNDIITTSPPPIPDKEEISNLNNEKKQKITSKSYKSSFAKSVIKVFTSLIISIIICTVLAGSYYLYYFTKINDSIRVIENYESTINEVFSSPYNSNKSPAAIEIQLSMQMDDEVKIINSLNCYLPYIDYNSWKNGGWWWDRKKKEIDDVKICLQIKLDNITEITIKILKLGIPILFLLLLIIHGAKWVLVNSKE